ncbi:hypothetical protein COY17_01690 [Candidatus Saccharibacteria bacterium CG_4_10_14_0_2_um_filter_52_9]|nr:MAG: hypothetical protein COY17_01690 [Candidatus Saccharibacteria bacterium CG_4_10_14_0_2_um_filter_52_9]
MSPREIKLSDLFKENYANRIALDPALVKPFDKRLTLFKQDRTIPELNDHNLDWEMQGLRAFSITKDIRVIYEETEDSYIFRDIGTHSQVYK